MVEKLGCIVAGLASTCEEAKLKLRAKTPDIVILDTRLEGAPTFELAGELAARGIAFAFSTSASTAMDSGYRDVPVLVKPFAVEALRDLLAPLVAAREGRRLGHDAVRSCAPSQS